jgi:hypothetical protein
MLLKCADAFLDKLLHLLKQQSLLLHQPLESNPSHANAL